MSVQKVSSEAISKALETLGLVDAEPIKDNDTPQPTEEELAKAQEVQALEQKAKELGFELKKAVDNNPPSPVTSSPDLGSAANGGTVTPQATPQVGKRKEDSDLIKGVEDKITALGTLLKAKIEENDELKKSVEDISEFNARLAEKLNMIEKQPMDRKSISTAKYIDKDFSKGAGDDAGTPISKAEKTLSLSNASHRAQVVEAMWDVAVKDNEVKDKEFAKAIEYVEISKSLGDSAPFARRIADRLRNELKINLVK